jgi:branched-chain amino acid transport system substrate-binding protein
VLTTLVLILAACVESGTTTTAAPSQTTAAPGTTSAAASTTAAAEAPSEIVIGNVIAVTGANNPAAALSQIPSYDLWAADVNAAGGIYVAEYDKQIPVRIERVDDTSDVGTSVQLVQQMLEEGEIDFLFPPWGTAFNLAIAPIVTEFQMPVSGCTVSAGSLAAEAYKYPYFYTMLNQPNAQGQALVDLLVELGVESVAVIHHTDQHGIEVAGVVVPRLSAAGIDVRLYKTYPLGSTEFAQLLGEAQDTEADAFLAFSYPDETFAITGQMIGMGYSPKLFYATVGIAFPVYRDVIFPGQIEGVMGAGVWNPQVETEGSQEYFDGHVAATGQEPDRWASAACYSSGQVLQQAIEAAGTLDRVKVKEAMDTTEFNTILGTFRFENNFNPVYPGQVGQWQNGEFMIVDSGDNRQAEPVYPKPAWPTG